MFRRFGVINSEGVKGEVLLNVAQILAVYVNYYGETVILMRNSMCYTSSIDYGNLSNAMDGMISS